MSHTTGYLKRQSDLLKRLMIFIRERFEPVSHLLMIFVFWYAHLMLSGGEASLFEGLLMFSATTLFFLKLRFYDEIKDYETDKILNPKRPLARGLLSIDETKTLIIITWPSILIFFALVSLKAVVPALIALIYGVLMYYEFFIPKMIRPHLTTYATSHTVVTLFLSLALLCAHQDKALTELTPEQVLFAVMSWLLFNIFELGRKTYQKSEEREGVDTYSIIWTRPGAVVLVLIQAVVAVSIGPFIGLALKIAWSIVGLLALFGLWYILDTRVISAKIYRLMSSFIIVLIYLTLIFSPLIDQIF